VNAGGLTLRLRLRGGKVDGVEIESVRPQAAGLLAGRTPEQAVRLVPLLFSLCGGAQGVAAQAALLAAQGKEPDANRLADWAATVRREATAEHLIRQHGEDASHNLSGLLSSALHPTPPSTALPA